MLDIDGSYGEGGGQILRTSLALSALLGRPIRITGIRAGRRNPGLAPQHLAGVQAVARLCDAEVEGGRLRSTTLVFRPQAPPRPGRYTLDVTDAAEGGSAGATSLIFQAVYLPLIFAGGPSHLTLRGGTHVAWSPPFDYIAEVFLPTVARMGVHITTRLDAWGFYPVGQGQVSVEVQPSTRLSPLTLLDRGPLQQVTGRGVACNLPADIAQRLANRAQNRLRPAGLAADITPRREGGPSAGAGIFLTVVYEGARAGFCALGARGKPADRVADEACDDLLAFHRQDAPVDPHLADQLLLPMALARGRSAFRTNEVTPHLLTNAYVIRQFLDVAIQIEGEAGAPGTVTVEGRGREEEEVD